MCVSEWVSERVSEWVSGWVVGWDNPNPNQTTVYYSSQCVNENRTHVNEIVQKVYK